VAFGAPAQEEWSARNLEVSGAAVGIGVGGTFDYLSGRVRRAPAWMRRAGLEWLFRLVREPWRARRMSVLPVFMGLVALQRLGLGRR
jgi:N-acetylglucosaminyldiphosphoundecaprenol N-acetyl-beta-D-mannosaminyltransferase